MFPLIPALLLLLLQGQAPLERTQAFATFDPLQWHAVVRQIEADGNNGHLPKAQVRALLELLCRSTEVAIDREERIHEPTLLVAISPRDRITAGFAKSVRTRDGPYFFA